MEVEKTETPQRMRESDGTQLCVYVCVCACGCFSESGAESKMKRFDFNVNTKSGYVITILYISGTLSCVLGQYRGVGNAG